MDVVNTPLTVDGEPLLRSLSELASPALWFGDRVNQDHIGAFAMPLAFPVIAVIIYLLSEPLLVKFREAIDLKRDNGYFKAFIFLHNVALAAFSLWVAFYSWPLAWRYFRDHGYHGVHCDREFWSGPDGVATWATIFYVSKFYEFVDTWILVLKNSPGKPDFLQKFHHVGIVFCMYVSLAAGANWIIWCVCLNSTIHTMMYTYYALATLGYRSPYAKILTNLQILQFITGITGGSCLYVYSDCETATLAVKATLLLSQIYAAVLIYLFRVMAKKKYAAKNPKKVS